ncbi:MAG: FHA domain-containing protein [Planctomycetia bacterium]
MNEQDDAAKPQDDREASGGPVLEPGPSVSRILRWIGDPQLRQPAGERFTLEDVHEFRPTLRPPVPVLTVLDDGSREDGEELRIRTEAFSIGRTAGTLVLANDPSLSGSHAEIRRVPWKGGFQWHLHDLGSVNGTFVRTARSVIHENTVMIIGARRFRLRNPLKPVAHAVSPSDTNHVDAMSMPQTMWPVLVEASGKPGAMHLPLRSERATIGRTDGGADIELDDPLVADQHAVLKRQRDGSWLLEADATRNGVWVSVASIMLTSNCSFRLGEQRFRFVVP